MQNIDIILPKVFHSSVESSRIRSRYVTKVHYMNARFLELRPQVVRSSHVAQSIWLNVLPPIRAKQAQQHLFGASIGQGIDQMTDLHDSDSLYR